MNELSQYRQRRDDAAAIGELDQKEAKARDVMEREYKEYEQAKLEREAARDRYYKAKGRWIEIEEDRKTVIARMLKRANGS